MTRRFRQLSRRFVILCNLGAVLCAAARLTTVQHDDDRLRYSGDWSTHSVVNAVYNFEYKDTVKRGSSVTLDFEGYLIEYWSVRGPTAGGMCSIDIDGQYLGTVNGSKIWDYESPLILFQRHDLDPSQKHTITVTAVDADTQAPCRVDSFVHTSSAPTRPVYAVESPTGVPIDTPPRNRPSSGTPVGAIVGGVVGGVAVLLLTGVLIWYLKRRGVQEELPDNIIFPETTPRNTQTHSQVSSNQITYPADHGGIYPGFPDPQWGSDVSAAPAGLYHRPVAGPSNYPQTYYHPNPNRYS
ncbi:hypothetical protein BOTBODRAFT_632205 [Botryobasidium botryosum FD-172 SS1]|uniref:Mid2 domain-containing protein n=1 Tax=Botryobasidium botryosum (strain FD-172 SS1) TaxID=930990 RepID=A0A067MZ36_BOTB1|nr:hypothetical protein BOTBODRAFT_632205 [Botryobasidium botryosum FD-172 SS1]